MKICNKCEELKSFNLFYKDPDKKDGFKTMCKSCCEIGKKLLRENRNIQPTINEKTCTNCNILKSASEFHKYKVNPDGLMHKCKECRKIDSKSHYLKNQEKKKKKANEYYYANREEFIKKTTAYTKKRAQEDILFRLARRLRNRLYYALKRASWKKGVKFNEYVGCSLEELKIHIEKQFTEGMSWERFGEFHLDHIIPLSNAKTEEEMYKLCHFSNLQPLWAKDNIKKSNKT